MRRLLFCTFVIFLFISSTGLSDDSPAVEYKQGPVTGKMIDAGFIYGDSNYHAIIQASDGNVYYVICSHNKKSGASMFRYDPRTEKVNMIADLTETVGENRTKTINQGKVHSDFYEVNGKLYFATHAGAWDMTYPGGHFMSYDLKTGKFTDFGIGVPNQGIVAMSMDTKRMRMYCMTWPGYTFCYYDIASGKTKTWAVSYAPMIQWGPRSIAVDPRTGNAYWHNMDETVSCYNYTKDDISVLDTPKFDAPVFKVQMDPGYKPVWRSIRWSEPLQKFIGVMYFSDWLFSFEPVSGELEIIERISSAPNRKSGKTYYSSLAFELSRDGRTVYYVCGNDPSKSDTIKTEELHLVTFDLVTRKYIDHGVIMLDDGRRPRYCQGLEIGTDGNLYIVAWIPFYNLDSEKGRKIRELLYQGKPTSEVEKSGLIQEINLIKIKNPLIVK